MIGRLAYRFPCLLACLAGWFVAAPFVAAQDASDCEGFLVRAEQAFFQARFDEAADLLESCKGGEEVSGDALFDLHLLRARVYYAMRDETNAGRAIESMLLLRPDYEARPPLPPPFIAFVDYHAEFIDNRDVLDVHLTPAPARPLFRLNRRQWLMIGGGVVLTGATLALINGREGPAESGFPAPPAPPLP